MSIHIKTLTYSVFNLADEKINYFLYLLFVTFIKKNSYISLHS
jgi:lipoprotein signal peptidase